MHVLFNIDICGLSDSTVFLLLLLLSLSVLSSPLYRVFTIIHLKQNMFLQYIVLQLFCIYNLCYSSVILHVKYVFYFYISTF